MPTPPTDQLRIVRAEAAAQLAARLAAGDALLPELRELQERLKILDTALAEQRARNERRLSASLWPVLLVAIALLLAATIPIPRVPLSLEVKASAITLTQAEPLILGPQSIEGELRIEGFTKLDSADAGLVGAASRSHADSLAVRSEQTRLRSLSLPVGSRLMAQMREDMTALLIESPHSPVIADVEVRGDTSLRLGDGEAVARKFTHTEALQLLAGDAMHTEQAAPPMTLWLPRKGDTALRLEGLRPNSLRFADRRAGAGAVSTVGSSLDGGTLTLPATAQTINISGGDWLEIDGLVVERCELIAGAPLSLKLSGSARALRLRVGEFERSLKPSWLEYISRHHLVSLLWGSAALLWGVLAWIRKHFSGALA